LNLAKVTIFKMFGKNTSL